MVASTKEIVYKYVKEGAPVIFLLISKNGDVIEANSYANKIIGQDLSKKKFSDIFIDFKDKLDLNDLSKDPSNTVMLNINTVTGLPQTFYFNFYKDADDILVLGKLDIVEQEKLRKEIINLNNELNNLTRELQKSNIELKKLNDLKNHFLGMAAHDLRNPLGLIMNYSEFILLEDSTLSQEHKAFLETILSSSELMRRLIDDFLDVSIIESGQFALDIMTEDMISVIKDGIKRLEFKAKKKQINIIFSSNQESIYADIDKHKIIQVFTNLLSNAIEYSFSGSNVFVECIQNQSEAIVSVKDEGPGIPENEIGNLFKFFGKASTKKTGGEKSTGIGLAIARKIIEAHKGKIWVESKLGDGAKFYFLIPIGGK
ncbi:MAG: adaptive-response sensory kinase [Candidatus Methanofastidiosum methylothiophilum]|uniref:histidine kinase n=1 Tax=Candidatus Methanofastidiosum methylothiophilum TaxID=1705564 RepID=A0A150J5Z9_9EURY|nr:MAG: adaptive-response sensory kinase [Candidatus Methanofastidiosum methylthiophilus]